MRKFAFAALLAGTRVAAGPLEDIIDHHPLVESTRASAGAARHAARGNFFSYPDPELEISRGRGREDILQVQPEAMVDRRKITDSEIQIRQPLPFPGKGTIDSMRMDARAAEEELRVRAVRNRLAREFLYLRTRERLLMRKVEVNTETMERVRTLERIAQIRYETGKSGLVDLSMLRVRESEAGLAVNAAQSELAALRRALEYFTEGSEKHNLSDEQMDETLEKLESSVRSLASKPDRALDLQMAAQELRQSDLDQTRSAMNYLPDFEIFAAYGKETRTSAAISEFSKESTYRAGVNIRVPLWSAFTNHWNVLEKTGNLEASRLKLDDAKRKLKSQLLSSLDRMDGIKRGLELHNSALIPGAMRAHDAARINYASGTADFAAVMSSLQAHFDHELSLIEHQQEYTSELLQAAEILDAFFPEKENEK